MNNEDYPITPPSELVRKWIDEATSQTYAERWIFIVEQAAQWGYDQRGEVNEVELQQARDQELEACCELLKQKGVPAWSLLRAARRPKPPNLKDLALSELETILNELHRANGSILTASAIRRALEALTDA